MEMFKDSTKAWLGFLLDLFQTCYLLGFTVFFEYLLSIPAFTEIGWMPDIHRYEMQSFDWPQVTLWFMSWVPST